MSVDGSASPGRHSSLFDALFGEAWTLERQRRKRYLALAALVCLAAGIVRTLTNGDKSSPASIASTKPVGLRAAGAVTVSNPQALLANANSLWIATPSGVVRLNLRSGSKLGRIPMPTNGVNAGLAFGAGSIWLAPTGASRLLRIDPSNNRLVANIHLGVNHKGRLSSLGGGVAFAAGRIWVSRVSNRPRGDVVSVNPTTNQQTAMPIAVGSGPDAIMSAFGSLWVDNTTVVIGKNAPSQTYPAVSRIDPRTRHVTTEPFSGTPVTGFGSLWVLQTNAGSDDAAIVRVNPATGKTLAQIDVPRVVGISSGDGRLWAISYPRSRSARLFEPIKGTAALWQIDPQTDRVIGRPVRLGLTQPVSIVVSDGQLWIADYQSGKVIHFQLTKH
jgi:sugar lactone lactonase YvrE